MVEIKDVMDIVARRSLTSELLLTCVCAFTARQLGLVASGEIWVPVATKYYTQALNLLIQQLRSPAPEDDTLSAVIILSSYEVLATQGQEYRRHFEGATKLIQMYGISAQSVGIDRANFWIWIRHEITVSITNEIHLQMSPGSGTSIGGRGKRKRIAWGIKFCGSSVELLTWYMARENYPNTTVCCMRRRIGIKYADPIEDGLRKIHFAVPAAVAILEMLKLSWIRSAMLDHVLKTS
ncbi:hypothetical protein KXW15_008221 [Aspergillus fumigatus]|nr:hypothetical protein KXW15_008221 [Aspergillus fumigatus]